MTDREIREALRALDEREDVEVTQWEGEFLESVVYGGVLVANEARLRGDAFVLSDDPLSDAQRAKALEILERYEHKGGGDQETIVRGPPEVMKHLRRQT